MKHLLLTIIAAVLVVGCGGPPKDIWEAAEQGDIEAVKEYLAAGTDVNAGGGLDDNGEPLLWTPLHHAAWVGHKAIAELLIENGADVNVKEEDGRTPLDWAKPYPELADLLRKHGGKTGEELKAEGK